MSRGRKKAEEDPHEPYGPIEESEKRLKSLSARLMSVQEEKRRLIAKELHDSFGQTLAAMKSTVEHASVNSDEHCAENVFGLLDRFVPVIRGAIDEVRNIWTGLRSPALDDLGIIAALRGFYREFGASFPNIQCRTLCADRRE
jgi:signal transduction histidine kinase